MNLTVYSTFPESLEAEWNDLLAHGVTHVPFLRFEYLRTWWGMRGGGEWPAAQAALVTAREDSGELVGIAPLFFTPDHQGRAALHLLGSIEISD